MRLPNQLQDLNVFGANQTFAGLCTAFTRPKLALKMESHRGGGMLGEVKLNLGLEPLECEHKYGGDVPALNAEFGASRIDASLVRFVGAYRDDESGGVTRVEITVRGRHEEIDRGDDEIGSKSSSTYKTACVYYKEVVNGRVAFEIDMLAGVWIVDGVDRWAEIRLAVL